MDPGGISTHGWQLAGRHLAKSSPDLQSMRVFLPSLLVPTLALALACTAKPGTVQTKERRATLVFVSDLWGQLEPCGCSADMRGGLDRMASHVAGLRKEGPMLFVDTGDALFDQMEYRQDEEVQARLRAKAVAKVLLEMGLDAKVLADRDAVLSDQDGDQDGWLPERVLVRLPSVRKVGDLRVGLLPVAGPASGSEAPADDLVAAKISEDAANLRKAGADVVIALAHLRRSDAGKIQFPGVDLVVGSHIESIPEGDQEIVIAGSAPILFAQARGQSLLQVEVVLRQGGEGFQIAGTEQARKDELSALDDRIRSYHSRIAALETGTDASPFQEKIRELEARRRQLAGEKIQPPAQGNYLAHRFVPITQDLGQDPSVKEILKAYDQEVATANLAYARAHPRACPEPAPGEASFVGQASCASCHPAAQAFWEGTPHGTAFSTLENAHKQYDLSCISCHVTGWEQPGGPCSVDKVEERKNVGCESCHGPGSLHASAPSKSNIARAVPEATCKSCHRPDHSLDFDHTTYVRRILGPGHGGASR